jgi:hypothetical protein
MNMPKTLKLYCIEPALSNMKVFILAIANPGFKFLGRVFVQFVVV